MPLGQSRNAFAREAIRASGARTVLDIGCGPGYLLCQIGDLECTGVDVDVEALAAARELCSNATIVEQTGAALPFADESFDAVVLSEVIEHVGDENKRPVIAEAHRVLRPGGTFILTAPFASATAWADPMDVKRRLPWLYGIYQRATGREPQTAAAIGHKHVSDAELRALFAGRFVVERCRYTGPISIVLLWLLVLAVTLRIPEPIVRRINAASGWESGIRCPRPLAFSVRLVATRLPQSDSGEHLSEALVGAAGGTVTSALRRRRAWPRSSSTSRCSRRGRRRHRLNAGAQRHYGRAAGAGQRFDAADGGSPGAW